MSDLSKLGYDYDDVSPPSGVSDRAARLQHLGVKAAAAEALVRSTAMPGQKTVELLGANNQKLRVTGAEAKISVALDQSVQRKLSASLESAATGAPAAPDRIFLNLENVRGLNDATVLSVYINVPEGEDPAKHPDHLVGSVALFGVSKATMANEEHAGNGLTFVLEISHVIDTLHLAGDLKQNKLQVQLVALNPVPEAAQVSIGRVSVFRQSA
jgi:tyrosinase